MEEGKAAFCRVGTDRNGAQGGHHAAGAALDRREREEARGYSRTVVTRGGKTLWLAGVTARSPAG